MKVPIRFWIAVMIFSGTYINYTTRVNLSVSIIAMYKTSKKGVRPECLPPLPTTQAPTTTARSTENGQGIENATETQTQAYQTQATQKPPSLPDYGPRYDWDEVVQGRLLGAYFIGYVVTSLPSGAPSEWWGPRQVVFWMQLATAVFNTISVPAAYLNEYASYWPLYICRFFVGAFAGFIYPALQGLIAAWAPPNEKGKFVAALMGNTLATCVTWPLTTSITQSLGWDWGFYVISIQILVFCAIWYFVAADIPEKQKCITPEEVEYITTAQMGKMSRKKRKPPYKKMFSNGPFWVLAYLHFCNLWGLYLQLTGVPKFMAQVIGFNLRDTGFVSALPHLARLILGIGFGILGDFLKKREVCKPVIIRKSFTVLSHIIPGILLIGIAFCGCNAIPVLVLLIFSMSVNGAAVMTNLQNAQDLAPNFAGSIFGIISFTGGMTGFIGPEVTAQFIKEHNGITEWGYVFMLGGVIYITGGVVFIILGSASEQPFNTIEE